MFKLAKNLAKGFLRKKDSKENKQSSKKEIQEVSKKDIIKVSTDDIKNRQEPTPLQTQENNTDKIETSLNKPIVSVVKKDFTRVSNKIDESDDTLEDKIKKDRTIGMASVLKGNNDGVQEKDLKESIKGLKSFIATEMDNTREEIKKINSDSDKNIGSKIQAIKQVTKDNLEVNKESLETQKSSLELAKDAAYNAAHRYKESLKRTAVKVKEKGSSLASAGVGIVKSSVDKQGGWLKTIMNILAGGYLIKKFWPVIKDKLWPTLKEKLWPWVKDKLWPFIQENFKEILGGLGLAAFLANPVGFLMAPFKLALKATGALGKLLLSGITSLTKVALKGSFEIGSKTLKYVGKGIKRAADLALEETKDIVKGLGESASKIASGTKELLGKALDKGKEFATKVISIGGALKDKVAEKLAPLTKTISDKVQIIKDGLKDKFAPLTEKLNSLTNKTLTKMSDAGGIVSKMGKSAMEGGGKVGKIATKGLGGLINLMKPLAKLIPFVGPVLTALDLIDTLFPNLKDQIFGMFKPEKIIEFGSEIWEKVKGIATSISEWVSKKISGIIGLIRGGLAGLISSTYGELPLIGQYANQLADFIRGKKVELDDSVKYGATEKDEKRAEYVQNKMEKTGAIKHNNMSKDDIKDWDAIEKLPANTIKGLMASDNFSDEDNNKMKKIIDVKKVEQDKKEAEEARSQSQKDKEQYEKDKKTMFALTKNVQNLKAQMKVAKENGGNTAGYANAIKVQEKLVQKYKDKTTKYEDSHKPSKSEFANTVTSKPANQTGYTTEDKDGKKVNISKEDNNRLKYAESSLASAGSLEEDKLELKLETLRKEIIDKMQNPALEVIELKKSNKKTIDQRLGMKSLGVGGYTGTGKDEDIAGVVHKNEYVLTPEDIKELDAAAKEGDNDNAIKRISDGKAENIEAQLKELMERRKEDNKETNKSYTIDNKEVKNVTKAQSRDIEKVSKEQNEALRDNDWKKMDEMNEKMDRLLESIQKGTYQNPDNKIIVPNKKEKTLAKSKKDDEKTESPKILPIKEEKLEDTKNQLLSEESFSSSTNGTGNIDSASTVSIIKNNGTTYTPTPLKVKDDNYITGPAANDTEGAFKPEPVTVKANIPKVTEESDKTPKSVDDIKESDIFKGAKLKDMSPDVEHNVKAMGYEYKERFGKKLQLNSTGRSIKEQQKLYDDMLKRNNGVSDGSVATPGGSMHNYGLAIDAQSNQLDIAEKSGLMEKFGFHRNVHKANGKLETWHMEATGIDRSTVRAAGKKAMKKGKDVDKLVKNGEFTRGKIKKANPVLADQEIDKESDKKEGPIAGKEVADTLAKPKEAEDNLKVKPVEIEGPKFDTSTTVGKKRKERYDTRFDIVPERFEQYQNQLSKLSVLEQPDNKQKERMAELKEKLDYFPGLIARVDGQETNANDDIFVANLAKDKDGRGHVSDKEKSEVATQEMKEEAMELLQKTLGGINTVGQISSSVIEDGLTAFGYGADLKGESEGITVKDIGSNLVNSGANLIGGLGAGVTNTLGLTNLTGSQAGNKIKETAAKGYDKTKELYSKGKDKLANLFSNKKKGEDIEDRAPLSVDANNPIKEKGLVELAKGPAANETNGKAEDLNNIGDIKEDKEDKKTKAEIGDKKVTSVLSEDRERENQEKSENTESKGEGKTKGQVKPANKNEALATSSEDKLKDVVETKEGESQFDMKAVVEAASSLGGLGSSVVGSTIDSGLTAFGYGSDLKGESEDINVKDIGKNLLNSGTNLLGGLGTGVTNTLGLTSLTGSGTGDKLKEIAGKGINTVKDNIPEGLKAKASKAGDKLKGLASSGMDKAKEMFGSFFGKKEETVEVELKPEIAAEIPSEVANQTELRTLDKTANQLGKQASKNALSGENVQVKNKREAGPKEIGKAGEKLAQKTAAKDNGQKVQAPTIINNNTQVAPAPPSPEFTLNNTAADSGNLDMIGIFF